MYARTGSLPPYAMRLPGTVTKAQTVNLERVKLKPLNKRRERMSEDLPRNQRVEDKLIEIEAFENEARTKDFGYKVGGEAYEVGRKAENVYGDNQREQGFELTTWSIHPTKSFLVDGKKCVTFAPEVTDIVYFDTEQYDSRTNIRNLVFAGAVAFRKGRIAKALMIFENVLADASKLYGEDHKVTKQCREAVDALRYTYEQEQIQRPKPKLKVAFQNMCATLWAVPGQCYEDCIHDVENLKQGEEEQRAKHTDERPKLLVAYMNVCNALLNLV